MVQGGGMEHKAEFKRFLFLFFEFFFTEFNL